MKQEFDPKLKTAAKEIEDILMKYDILASMLLVSPSHSEYLFHLKASWSVMTFDGMKLRFRSKLEDFKSKEEQDKSTEASVHAITSFLQFGRMCERNMQLILEDLGKTMKIAYEVWKPHGNK